MPDKSNKDAVIEAILDKMRKQLQEQLSNNDQTIDQIEETAYRIGRSMS